MRSEDEAAELTRPDSKKNVKQNSVSSWFGTFGSGGWSSPTKTSARASDADYSPMGHSVFSNYSGHNTEPSL
eukprot:9532-Heterococcus_DN1.PRE.1